MTATVEAIINVAKSQLGYLETGGPDGHSGNITKYWAELDPADQGQPWCAAFQRYVDIHAGGPDLPVSNPYYCPTLVTYAKQHGLWLPAGSGNAGDMVIFNWNKDGVADHVGRVISVQSGQYTTIEGNTSAGPGDVETQRNGGGVFERERTIDSTVLGIIDYSRLLAHAASNGGQPPRNPVKGNPYAASAAPCKAGAKGNQVRFVQWAVGVPVDGSYGPQTIRAVRLFQQYHGLAVDGVVGYQTIGKLRGVTH